MQHFLSPFFAGSASIDTFASEEKNAQVPVITNTVENGGYYQVYEGSTKVSQQGARIVVSKQVRVVVSLEGDVVPSSTYRYSVYDSEYGTTMTGTLSLVSYRYDGIFQIIHQLFMKALFLAIYNFSVLIPRSLLRGGLFYLVIYCFYR